MSREEQADLPIGVFDSGLGGLTVVHALRQRFPHERILYLGDTARVPYGTRSRETVLRYAESCSSLLMRRGIKGLVVACNTVSAVALDDLRTDLDLPVIGVVKPGARAALRCAAELEAAGGETVRIGVLATAGTVASGAYPRAVAQLSTRHEVVQRSAPLLVPLVEEGWLDGLVPELAVERYLRPLIDERVRVLVLGCTHYPVLRELIQRVADRLMPTGVSLVDSGEATADVVESYMGDGKLLRSSRREAPPVPLEILVTDLPSGFRTAAERFLGEAEVPEVRQVDL